MSEKKQMVMYNKLPKRKLIEMLIECKRILKKHENPPINELKINYETIGARKDDDITDTITTSGSGYIIIR